MTASPYDLLAQAYDQETHATTAVAFASWFLEATAGHALPRVLDVGCGTGVLAAALAGRIQDIVAVDRSLGMLGRARVRLNGSRAAAVICADMLQLPFAPGFDAVTACNEVVNQLPTEAVGSFARQAAGVLRPGGWLCFDALGVDHFARFWDGRHWQEEVDGSQLWMDCAWEPALSRGVAFCTALTANGGRVGIRTAALVEYLHDVRTIEAALAGAGFVDVRRRPWNPYAEPQPDGFVDRHLWSARTAN